ncbi:hypothetical protein Tco_0662387 [Tanacetum coccineum]
MSAKMHFSPMMIESLGTKSEIVVIAWTETSLEPLVDNHIVVRIRYPHNSAPKIREKASDETEVLLEEEEEEEATKIVQDQGSGEKGEQEVSTADTSHNTANVPISTASDLLMLVLDKCQTRIVIIYSISVR